MKYSFQTGIIALSGLAVPLISTELNVRDILGTFMVRWGINRDHYRVNPGLYAVGSPDQVSDVLVTANYKLTFDNLRRNLAGLNVWILVLDTKGVNVWCAAGKGTFGTRELVHRIREVSLDKIVSHKRIIVPQLGATGVAAHKVKEETGFNVHYGPVRAADVKKFIADGYRADKEMRKVTFRFADRIKLIPNDFMYGKYYLLGAMAVIVLISLFPVKELSIRNSLDYSFPRMLNIFLAYCSGIVLTPALLPYIPFRRFAAKGLAAGLALSLILFLIDRTGENIFEDISWFLIVSAISSFLAMNFTGSSTYTSLSGVKKEMKTAVPMQIIFAATGIILLIIGKLI
jgi:hypothetical protein